ncbi:PTS cellobiose transporter subunit IIB [Aerococcus loyolae]|uniref:PTS cellobiose transporter subunit IIB n=1 Tax=Aerococcus loyolae TaxID=2976809 RepID=A0ABT4C0U4_9LACT|nr:PTS cellobiose transporter subunit IIB [Aerococcus loyolae]MCY3025293.1 PTS cellobiose transporter subunit IIB [Aerococcus loyolae]MCY3027793.1 PTS cellobiose transporter subunit IIB [Aerococcus loyolae]MCY3029170.1 PTS cellobiose transporter subunit IIB [Aerococcus loyolae]
MMKKALIICAAGMSSSMIAKKLTDYFSENGKEIEVDATTISKGPSLIQKDAYDLYMVSPQAKMQFKNLKAEADKKDKPIINIPPQTYVPIPTATQKLAGIVEESL